MGGGGVCLGICDNLGRREKIVQKKIANVIQTSQASQSVVSALATSISTIQFK